MRNTRAGTYESFAKPEKPMPNKKSAYYHWNQDCRSQLLRFILSAMTQVKAQEFTCSRLELAGGSFATGHWRNVSRVSTCAVAARWTATLSACGICSEAVHP